MVYDYRKSPRYSEHMESGVLFFVAPRKSHGELCGIRIWGKSVQLMFAGDPKTSM